MVNYINTIVRFHKVFQPLVFMTFGCLFTPNDISLRIRGLSNDAHSMQDAFAFRRTSFSLSWRMPSTLF